MPHPTKLFVVEDHPITRAGFIAVLQAFDDQFVVVGEAANGEEALAKIPCASPEVLITDLHFTPNDPSDGIDLIALLREKHPEIKVLMLTGELDDEYMALAHDVGACGFLSKTANAAEIARAIGAVSSGFTHFPERLRSILDAKRRMPQLTEREAQIIPLIAACKSAKEIAQELCALDPGNPITYRTVENHKANIRQKLDLDSTSDLIPFAIQYAKRARRKLPT